VRHAGMRASRARLALGAAGGRAVAAALAAPISARASTCLSTAESTLTSSTDLGNLAGPLQKWELFGIWPSGDFRFGVTTHMRATYALIGIAALSAVLGTLWSWRRRSFGPLLLIA